VNATVAWPSRSLITLRGPPQPRRHARGSASNRRRASSRGRVERGILTAYWLVSGYGLRSWRALAWLAILTAAFAAGVHVIGFTNPPLVTWLLRGVLGCQGTNTTTTPLVGRPIISLPGTAGETHGNARGR
jgi:hypothetical protein